MSFVTLHYFCCMVISGKEILSGQCVLSGSIF